MLHSTRQSRQSTLISIAPVGIWFTYLQWFVSWFCFVGQPYLIHLVIGGSQYPLRHACLYLPTVEFNGQRGWRASIIWLSNCRFCQCTWWQECLISHDAESILAQPTCVYCHRNFTKDQFILCFQTLYVFEQLQASCRFVLISLSALCVNRLLWH
jgi:hypothetical protein